MDIKVDDKDLPGLYQIADSSSQSEQLRYFICLALYLLLLFVATIYASYDHEYPNPIFKITSALLFIITLSILVWLKVKRPDVNWYNGRAVAESVKTRAWRWMMKTEPYDMHNDGAARAHFVGDLKEMLKQNENLFKRISISKSIEEPLSQKMLEIRKLSLAEREDVYRKERITNQALWYAGKARRNRKSAGFWFWSSVILHASAILLLLYNIMEPELVLHIEIIAVAASSVLAWLEAKKHNELSASYALTAHEITLIRSEATDISTEAAFSTYVMNCENAFSREHIQWFARKQE